MCLRWRVGVSKIESGCVQDGEWVYLTLSVSRIESGRVYHLPGSPDIMTV